MVSPPTSVNSPAANRSALAESALLSGAFRRTIHAAQSLECHHRRKQLDEQRDGTKIRKWDAVLKFNAGIPELAVDVRTFDLARKLIEGKAVPKEYPDDALHIAIAALHSVDYLVSWNFKHITNAETIPLVRKICEANGYSCPEICTPQMLQKGELS